MSIQNNFAKTNRLEQHFLSSNDQGSDLVLFIHGNASSSIFWKRIMADLPQKFRGVAPDLRGYGQTEDRLIDAKTGTRVFADDLISLLEYLEIKTCHVVGHSMGGSVIYSLAAHYPEYFRSITLVNPGSPYGFGGTKDLNGTPHFEDFAGSGGGVVNPEFARRIHIKDRSTEDPIASPRVVMNAFYWKPPFVPLNEDELLEGLLSQKTGPDKYPGDFVPSENFPFVAPGDYGPANALSPKHLGGSVSGFMFNAVKIPILWIRGDEDQIVSDYSLFDLGVLGKMGLIPNYPGEQIYPPQPMVSQTRAVLESIAKAGGRFTEIVMNGCGHTPFIEKEDQFKVHFFDFLNKQS